MKIPTCSFVILIAIPIACTCAADPDGIRESLMKTQEQVRETARRMDLLTGKQRTDYYSAALETDSDDILRAHEKFEAGLLAELNGNKKSSLENWKAAADLLEKTGEDGKPWLRRVNGAIAERMLKDLHFKNDLPGMITTLKAINALTEKHPLPDSEHIPIGQLHVEHWIYSSLKMFEAREQIGNAPGNFEAQMRILRRTLREVCSARLLMKWMASQEQAVTHEQIVDHATFDGELAGMFTSLFYNMRKAGQPMTGSGQAVWTALLAAWATEATDEHLTPAAFDGTRLSSLEAADRFRALAEALAILDEYHFPDARPKLAKGVSFLDASLCPSDATALAIADLLIEGGQPWSASPYLEKADKGGFPAEVQAASVKLLFHAGEPQRAIEQARAAFGGKAIESFPPEIHFWLGKSLLKAGLQKDAREEFLRFFEIAPESVRAPEASLLAGMLSFNIGESAEAARLYELTASRYPSSREGQRAAEFLCAQDPQ